MTDIGHRFSGEMWKVSNPRAIRTERDPSGDVLEQAEHLIVLYPCLYDPTQRRLITVDAQGRQQYRHFPMLQLALFTLERLRVVWKMLPYRRSPWSRRLLQVQQGSLFERFAR